SMSLIASMWLAELLVALGDVEDVVDDLEEDPQLASETAIGNCLRFAEPLEDQDDADAGGDQAAGLQRVQGTQPRRIVLGAGNVDVLAAAHAVDPGRASQLAHRRQHPRRLAGLAAEE